VAGVKIVQHALMLPFLLALGVAGHAALSRALKAVLWSWAPLATGEPQSAAYERQVYHTADRPMQEVVALAAAAGLLLWLALVTGHVAWWPLPLAVFVAALGLDLLRWERVAVSANHLWFQRGWHGRVHQVALENIRDVNVSETDGHALTLRHGRRGRLVRLAVRMSDRRVVALPKTDAANGAPAVAAVAHQLRLRLAHLRDRAARRLDVRPALTSATPEATAEQDRQLRLALLRLRQAAAAQRQLRAEAPR
jgi:hypothetical protein